MAAKPKTHGAEAPKRQPNYITRPGMKKLEGEYRRLMHDERPKLVKVIEWAASNGDRSENADYIYGKRRLREIDKRLEFLLKKIEAAVIVDPAQQKNSEKIFFGATVTLEDEDGEEFIYQIVGEDETNVKAGKISWLSPIGKALLGKKMDHEVRVKRPAGSKTFTIISIAYVTDE